MRTLLTIAALLAAAPTLAADLGEREARAMTLIVDFCGAITGDEAADATELARRIPGLIVGAPLKIADHDPAEREALMELFKVATDELVLHVGFDTDPNARVGRSNPSATLSPDKDTCVVVTSPYSPALTEAVTKRLEAPGTAWKREDPAVPPGSLTWRRPTPLGETVFLLLSNAPDSSITVTAVEQRPVSTPEQILGTTRAALEPCLSGVMAGKAPDFALLGSHFVEMNRETQDIATAVNFRSTAAGPRSFLRLVYFQGGVLCRFMTADVHQPVEQVRSAVMQYIRGLPGVQEIAVKAKGDQPAGVLWRVKRKGQRHAADIKVSLHQDDIVVVDVSRKGS